MAYFSNAPEASLNDAERKLLDDTRGLLERLDLPRLGRTQVETEDDGFGLIIERDDETARLLVGLRQNEDASQFITVGADINGTPILMPRVAPDDVTRVLEGLLTGSMRLAVLMFGASAVRVDVVDPEGRTLGKYGLMSRWIEFLFFWKRRAVFQLGYSEPKFS